MIFKTQMYGKLIGLVVLLAVTLVTGIGIGRYCFPQRIFISPPAPPTPHDGGMTGTPAAGGEGRSDGGSAAGTAAGKSGAERLAEFMAGHPDINEQSDFCKKLITELCAQGRDDEAYALIDKNPGLLRDVGMFTFYSHRQFR